MTTRGKIFRVFWHKDYLSTSGDVLAPSDKMTYSQKRVEKKYKQSRHTSLEEKLVT